MARTRKSKFVVLICSTFFLAVLLYVIDHSAEALTQVLLLLVYASLPVAGGLIALSLFSLVGTFTDVENSVTSHLLRRISEDPGRNFLIGFLVTAYLSLVRPFLAVTVSFLPYVEWVTIALAVYVVYHMTRFSTSEIYVDPEGQSFKRHTQEAKRETGQDLARITSVMEQFVSNKEKEPLLVYLTSHLQRLGKTEEEILRILSPLISYEKNVRKRKFHFLAFPWTKKKLAMRNKKARENLLNGLLEKIDEVQSE